MNVLVIGSGGREHALAWRLSHSPRVDRVTTCPGNGGVESLGPRWTDVDPSDADALLARIRDEEIGFVVIGPEAPLVDGLANRLRAEGIPTFGPDADAALLEGSKIHAKEFMARHGIPTARYVVVQEESEIETALAEFDRPTVVKADGLAAGKGVIVSRDHEEAAAAAREMICESRFGDAGRRVII
ncbi:MAG: ATP-grasp domain-containing protein, partial [Planctomycetota bacterium]